jgi:hypothetical protein
MGVTLTLDRIQGNAAEIAVDAPKDVIVDVDSPTPNDSAVPLGWLSSRTRHAIRNELHAVRVGMELLRDELLTGRTEEAQDTYRDISEALDRLDSHPALNPGSRE